MKEKEDEWILQEIFRLSNHAVSRLLNRLFDTDYTEKDEIWRDWTAQEGLRVGLKVRGMNRYEFHLRQLDGCLQLCAEDKGYAFHYEHMGAQSVVQIKEPQILYFGKNQQERYSTTLEFPGHERVILPYRVITLADYSAQELEEQGLILFLPFLFYCFKNKKQTEREKEEGWKLFIGREITGALNRSFQRGTLTAYDVERMKQLCRHMAWQVLCKEPWMQELDSQKMVLDCLEADLGFLKRMEERAILRCAPTPDSGSLPHDHPQANNERSCRRGDI